MVVDEHAGQSQDGLIACREMSEHCTCEVAAPMTPDHTAFQVRSSGYGRA